LLISIVRGLVLRYVKDGEQAWLMLLSVVVGLIVGCVSALFRYLIRLSHHLFFEATHGSENLLLPVGNVPAMLFVRALLPAAGGLIVGYVIYKVLNLKGSHGVPSVMKAVATGKVNLAPSMMIKSWSAIITITSGGSVGQEGSSIEIGSVFGSLVGQAGQIPKDRVATLIGCGAAGGIAGVFNAPIGGVFLALELILRDFAVKTFAPVVIAAVVASVTSQAILPNSPVFIPLSDATMQTISPNALLIMLFALLGALCGVMSTIYVYTLFRTSDLFNGFKLPTWIKPMLGGLGVGLVGLAFPTVIGEGYAYVNSVLLQGYSGDEPTGHLTLFTAILLLAIGLIKIFATSLTLGSGGTGGTFAPAMVIGACTGGGFGVLCNVLLPGQVPAVPVFALVGMAGCVGSALSLPIAGILIIYEVSGANYLLVLPLMICVATSSLVSSAMAQGSVYTLSLLRDGFDVEEHLRRQRDPLLTMPVRRVMKRDFVRLRKDDNLEQMLEVFASSSDESFAVVDEREHLVGIITANDLRGVFNMGEVGEAIIATDAADVNPPVLYLDSTVGDALTIFGHSQVSGIPVLAGRKERLIVGLVSRSDILGVYRGKGDPLSQ
jgi:CIC family chloride channel protein